MPHHLFLFIDDEPDESFLMNISLRKSGVHWHMIVAEDGAEGLRILENEPGIDFVVTDLEMPRMSGYVFLETLRASFNFSHLPVIVRSNAISLSSRERCELLGADRFLSKECSMPDLEKEVEQLLTHKMAVLE